MIKQSNLTLIFFTYFALWFSFIFSRVLIDLLGVLISSVIFIDIGIFNFFASILASIMAVLATFYLNRELLVAIKSRGLKFKIYLLLGFLFFLIFIVPTMTYEPMLR